MLIDYNYNTKNILNTLINTCLINENVVFLGFSMCFSVVHQIETNSNKHFLHVVLNLAQAIVKISILRDEVIYKIVYEKYLENVNFK